MRATKSRSGELLNGVGLLLGALVASSCGEDSPTPAQDAGAESNSSPTVSQDPKPSAEDFADSYAIMTGSCMPCHHADTGHSFIVEDTLEATLPSAVAAKAKIKVRINSTIETERMPPQEGVPLTAAEITTLTSWIESL